MISGKKQMANKFNPYPVKSNTANITTNVSSILINMLVTYDIGKITLGKYIFLIKFSWLITQVEPLVTEILKKFHGTRLTNKKIGKFSIPYFNIKEKTTI